MDLFLKLPGVYAAGMSERLEGFAHPDIMVFKKQRDAVDYPDYLINLDAVMGI
jgi:hypothetical protein